MSFRGAPRGRGGGFGGGRGGGGGFSSRGGGGTDYRISVGQRPRKADLSQGAAVFNNPTALQHQS